MTQGWALEILIVLLGLLVLVGVIAKCSSARDDEKRRRSMSGAVTDAVDNLQRPRHPTADDMVKPPRR
jgi:hypothetical protein